MKSTRRISKPVTLNFYINLLNLILFLAVIITGFVIQLKYHLNHLPDDYPVAGLNRSDLLNLHKIFSAISLVGIIIHCLLHWKFISGVTQKIFTVKSGGTLSFYLFLIFLLTVLTSIVSWLFFSYGDTARFALVEIHDKLAILLIILFILHFIKHFGWMIKTFQKIMTSSI